MTSSVLGRIPGLIETVQSYLPESLMLGFAIVTQLGSVPVLIGIATAIYWLHNRRTGAYVVGVVLGAVALTIVLKTGFAFSRPPASLWMIQADGYGFPSGHATAAAVTWGALALVVDRGTPWYRWVVAACLVGLIGLSRIVLGVHYPIDVIAGFIVGGGYLALVTWWGDFDPTRTLLIAALVGLSAIGMTGGSGDALLLGGITVGAVVAWNVIDIPEHDPARVGIYAALGGVGIVGGTIGIGYFELIDWPAVVEFGLGVMAGLLLIGWPVITRTVWSKKFERADLS